MAIDSQLRTAVQSFEERSITCDQKQPVTGRGDPLKVRLYLTLEYGSIQQFALGVVDSVDDAELITVSKQLLINIEGQPGNFSKCFREFVLNQRLGFEPVFVKETNVFIGKDRERK
jgi:hypothetical protein